MQSYSQSQQDIYLYQAFLKNIQNGYYVDIGAHNGIDLSNTLFYEKIGWDGVCVEPIQKVFNDLQKNRKCKCINGAVSDKDVEFVEFCEIDGSSEMLSGIVEDYDNRHKLRIINEGCNRKKVKVKNYKFSEIVEPRRIDYLDIDTEGNELKILKTIDFNLYPTKVIAVENNFDEPFIGDYLISQGFAFITRLGADQIFLNPKY